MPTMIDRHTWQRVLREQGRTMTWLAQRTGVSRATVYAYANGARRPTDTWLRKSAEILGVPASMFVGVA